MQLFLEQQQQFRSQMGGMLGQTRVAMLNQLTDRNMALGKDFQQTWAQHGYRPRQCAQ